MKTTWILALLALAPACQNPAAPEDGAAHPAAALASAGPGAVVTGTVLDAKKSRIVFLVGQAGTVLIDDVKVSENMRLQASRP